MSVPIPQPPGLPLVGNIYNIDPANSQASILHLFEKYGPFFSLTIFGMKRYLVGSVELLDELCDEKRFHKSVSGNLEQLRYGIGDGLFTAYHGSHAWEVAHRTLVPAFGPISISSMFDEMYDIGTQLVAKWARLGGDEKIHVTDDFTRLTLDSIALCAMDKRFNSFYHEELHPFVNAMTGFLAESGKRNRRTKLEAMWNTAPQKQYEADIALMKSVAQEVIDRRRANPVEKKDLLNAMLFGKDPKTGERMSDELIMNNMITFLIAGHETTSGLLSFTTFYLLRNPEAYHKAQAEVDSVVGRGPIHLEHMSHMPYLEAAFREALRLEPTAPGFTVTANDKVEGPTVLAGKYYIPQGADITVYLPAVGRDPQVFGTDANEYRPERMYKENFERLPRNAWKPFGNGARGCIGRPFAWQEALLAMALVLQNFNLRLADPSYQLKIKQTLTIKPDELEIYATLREGIDPVHLERKLFAGPREDADRAHQTSKSRNKGTKPMTILYGSNAGTCEGLAQSLANAASGKGFAPVVKTLDAAVDQLPDNQPVVVITSSYEGQPPDNAAVFVEWLKKVEPQKVKGVHFSVFGCGHHDWVATFHRIPKLIEDELTQKGATLISPCGNTDVAANTIFNDFDAWQDEHLWPALTDNAENEAAVEGLDMEINTTSRASHLHHNVQDALVLDNHLLSAPGEPEKWHMELKLPTSLTFEAGDYMAILPINSMKTVHRVLRRFGLPFDATLTLKKGTHTTIPTEHELTVSVVLGAYVEFASPATKKNITVLEKYAPNPDAKSKVSTLPNTRASVLEILEAVPEIQLPFAVYLAMLPPMRIRQYSISSSPLKDPTVASLTYSVVDNHGGHPGVATNFLRLLQKGSIIQVAVKKSHAKFHLPLDDSTPIIMLGAGTGIAPFRGFVEERATKLATNPAVKLGEAALFIGCRDPEKDKLYADELATWEKDGAVKLYYAFSRDPDKSEDCKHVQDRLYKERKVATELFRAGARAYICGSAAVGKGISEVVAKIVVENAKDRGKETSFEEGMKWWEGLRNERYAVDVFD